jgi:tetratricopeptide (TPR) repeat protein
LLKLAQGQGDAARAAFEKAVELDPTSLKARLALTYFYLSTGNAALAEKTLRSALEIAPDDPLANRTLATLYLGTGRHTEAEKPLKLVVDVTKSARSKFALADYYEREGRANDARQVLEPMTSTRDTYADAQTRLGRLVYESGDREKGKKLLDEVLARYPSHSLALQTRARWDLADGRQAQALERAKAAVAAAPQSAEAYYFLGTMQALNNQPEAATTSFNHVLKLNPRAAAAQVQASQLRLTRGDSAAAVNLAREAVSNAPNVPEARLVLARALVAEHDFARAEAEINRLLTAFPRAGAVYSLKGTLYLLKGDRAVARQAYQRGFELAPTSIAALTGLTMLDVQEKRIDLARARLETRLVEDAKRPDVLVLAAKVYVAAGDVAKAEHVLRQAIQLAPGLPEPYAMLVDIYRSQSRLATAQAQFDGLIQRDASDIGARVMAATLVHAQNNTVEAKRRYVELLAMDPRAVIAANNLAWIYADEKQNLDAALDLAGRATEQLPDYAEAWDTLGWVYYRKQLPLLAIDPFEKAIARAPGNATFHYHLALAFIGGGDRARARESLQRALKIQPDFKDAQEQMRALGQS